MTSRYKDHILGLDTHANRPAATAVPEGAQYSCSTHGLIYKAVGGAWVTWATLGLTAMSMDSLTDADTTTTVPVSSNILVFNGTNWVPKPSGFKSINAQTGTTYTLVAADAGQFVTMSNAAASTLTVPPNSSVAFLVGSVIEGAQLGAGQVTLTPGAGVTINGTPGLKVAAQYGTFGLLKTATDTWLAYGRLSA